MRVLTESNILHKFASSLNAAPNHPIIHNTFFWSRRTRSFKDSTRISNSTVYSITMRIVDIV